MQKKKEPYKSNNRTKHPAQIDADIAKSLDVLDSVIGEFDDGFLSESDARSFYSNSDRKPSKSQFIFNDKIDRMFDDVYEESKVERLNNFGSGANVGHEK